MGAWFEAAQPDPQGCLVLDAGAGDLVEPARLARFASACARIPVLVLAERGDVPTAVRDHARCDGCGRKTYPRRELAGAYQTGGRGEGECGCVTRRTGTRLCTYIA